MSVAAPECRVFECTACRRRIPADEVDRENGTAPCPNCHRPQPVVPLATP